MPLLHVLILAVVQGITEFLPISSSAHLVLTWSVFDWAGWDAARHGEAQRLILDVAVHVGTLGAVMVYFWRDVGRIALGLLRLAAGRRDEGARLAGQLVIASLPIFAAGYLLKDLVTEILRNQAVIAWATLGFGVLLWLADRLGMTVRGLRHMTARDALVVGCAQALALIPGTSRAGITITAARFLGFERDEAAHISMLLAIPAILGAGALAGADLYRMGRADLTAEAGLAAGLAFLAALVSIAAMMAWLRRATYTPFVVYRVLLGGFLLWLLYGGAETAWLGLAA